MSSRVITINIRLDGDTGVTDRTVLEAINKVITLSRWKLDEHVGEHHERSEVIASVMELLPSSGGMHVRAEPYTYLLKEGIQSAAYDVLASSGLTLAGASEYSDDPAAAREDAITHVADRIATTMMERLK